MRHIISNVLIEQRGQQLSRSGTQRRGWEKPVHDARAGNGGHTLPVPPSPTSTSLKVGGACAAALASAIVAVGCGVVVVNGCFATETIPPECQQLGEKDKKQRQQRGQAVNLCIKEWLSGCGVRECLGVVGQAG
jgi:hypothetical protein